MTDDSLKFENECAEQIIAQGKDHAFSVASHNWLKAASEFKYVNHFKWLGRPIIQIPQDMLAMQEIIFEVKPDLIIETGIARGGSLIFYASLLELNAVCGGPAQAQVLGLDIELRDHNRKAIEVHPLFKRIANLDGSSVDPEMVARVCGLAKSCQKVLVCLDSCHIHEHVLAELEAYAPLVTLGSYCVVFDTIVELMMDGPSPDRPWGKGNNPMTAVAEFLSHHHEFAVDEFIDAKLMVSAAPRGYLKRIR